MGAGSNFAFSSQGPDVQDLKAILEGCMNRKLPHLGVTLETRSQ